MIISGTDLYQKCIATLQKPHPTKIEIDIVFQDLNALLETGYVENDEHIATIWFTLGTCLLKMNDRVMALLCFKECLKTKPNFLEALNNTGYIYKKLNFSQEALDYFGKIIELVESGTVENETDDISKSEYYTNYGSMFVCNGTAQKAIGYFDRAIALNANNITNKYNKGLAQLELGDYENGFEGYDIGERIERIANRHYGYNNLPVWDGTPGKNVVVIGEQGLGDELMFGTIIQEMAKDCNVVLDCHPRLANMFRRSFPEVHVYGTRKDAHDFWGTRYKLEAKVLMGSLPKYYRKKEEDFPKLPYLVVNEKYEQRYAEILNDMGPGYRPKVGISWRGGTKQTGRNHRYIEMEKLLPLLRLECDFISLQYDHDILKEVEDFNKAHNVKIHHWPEMLEDYEKTAGLVKNLDLIISVPQSVIHLAGVIGEPLTWQLCPFKSLWQVGPHGKDAPWYGNVKNFWQDESCTWDNVLETIKDELCKLLQTNTEN